MFYFAFEICFVLCMCVCVYLFRFRRLSLMHFYENEQRVVARQLNDVLNNRALARELLFMDRELTYYAPLEGEDREKELEETGVFEKVSANETVDITSTTFSFFLFFFFILFCVCVFLPIFEKKKETNVFCETVVCI